MRALQTQGCGTASHFNRRTLLKAGGLAGLSWLTPLSARLARAEDESPRGATAKSVIVLWLQGGPSQLETFDPHPGKRVAAGSRAIKTSVPGIQLGEGFEQLADQMHHISIVRSIVSKEGDHERATYNVKTGFRPDPTLVHPSIGSVICHNLADTKVEIPRHVSILPGQWPARGGYLGDQYDAFKTGDPIRPVPDVSSRVRDDRFARRLRHLEFVEREYRKGRIAELEEKTLHRQTTQAAVKMMSSEQLRAFDVGLASKNLLSAYGDTEFGRGCLAAARLVETGVRCVEVTLNGFDSHVNNHETHKTRMETLDPAFASLLRDLEDRQLLDSTIVLCGGEFGRTPGTGGKPGLNPADGRDHWPHGFSIALAGGGIRGGLAIGETSPDPKLDKDKPLQDVVNPKAVEDIHATAYKALGINFHKEESTPVGRPMIISEGRAIDELVA